MVFGLLRELFDTFRHADLIQLLFRVAEGSRRYISTSKEDMWQGYQKRAVADQFCNAVVIDSATTNLAEQAKASGGSMGSGSNANPQRFGSVSSFRTQSWYAPTR